MTISRHAADRGKERLALNPKAMTRLADHAWTNGKHAADFRGSFKRYLDGESLQYRSVMRVHGEYVYAFTTDGRLITVFLLPLKYRRIVRKIALAAND